MKLIPVQVTRTVSRQILIAQKNSPHILFGLGLAGVVTATILACRATLKLNDTLDEIKVDIDKVKQNHGNVIIHGTHVDEGVIEKYEYSSKELANVYLKGSYDIAKLYAPAVIIGAAAISALTGSHIALSRRNAALTAAYAAVSKAYSDYRDRVKQEIGEEKELDIYRSVTTKTEKGTGEVKSVDPNTWSPYAKFFDERSSNWKKNAELNRLFIECQQRYANHLLHARGHVFLNEVYDMLDIGRTQAGAVVGWVLNQGGDNYIDFGMFEASNSGFVNGWERSIILDFNVDGIIYDKI